MAPLWQSRGECKLQKIKRADMAYWLMKTEPGTWSWDDQVRDGTAEWDGVRNYQASNNMKAMRVGDRAFFYHSVNEKRIVGIVEVAREYYPDPTDASSRFGMVDVRALKPMNKPVSLADIKAEPKLQNLALIRQSRLSVMPIDDESWALICQMGETEA
jgi:predicted RNA-binding protein with PUA-like domain